MCYCIIVLQLLTPWDVSVPRFAFRIVDWTSYHETRPYRIYILSEDNLQWCFQQIIVLGMFCAKDEPLTPWMLNVDSIWGQNVLQQDSWFVNLTWGILFRYFCVCLYIYMICHRWPFSFIIRCHGCISVSTTSCNQIWWHVILWLVYHQDRTDTNLLCLWIQPALSYIGPWTGRPIDWQNRTL